PWRYCLLSWGGKTMAAAALLSSRTRFSASARLTSRTSACSPRSFMNVLATGPPSSFTTGTTSRGPLSLCNRASAMIVTTSTGTRMAKSIAQRSRTKMRRSLRRAGSMVRGLARGGGAVHLLAQQLQEILEAALGERGIELRPEVLRQAHLLDQDVGRPPAALRVTEGVVDGEPIPRGNDLRTHGGGFAGDALLAVGEVGCVEEEQALHVGADEELAEEPQELRGLLRGPAVEVLAGGEASERLRVEEISQDVTQREQLLLTVAAAADDRVAPLERLARHRARALGRGWVGGRRPAGHDQHEHRAEPSGARHQSRSSLPVSSRNTSSSVTGLTRVCTMA